ncbi:hypothetical protein Leryth_004819 [Lithospermum erythrorhizon]|nr:hypothetical protein Leryth_004819 [Lithospermum erythrorhizon]
MLVCFILSSVIDSVLVSGQCLSDQRALLLELKRNLKFSNVSSTKLITWNADKDCCRWNGVGCDTSGRVTRLELDGEGITAGIENSTSLFSLEYLKTLNLANNAFGAIQIPKGIGNLSNLENLNLSNADFVGQIPIELSNLKNLSYLALATLFPEIQSLKLEDPNLKILIQGLPNLQELYLDNVDLSAQRTQWCQALASSLPNLRVLSLVKCNISGPIHESLSKLQSLSMIILDQNNLTEVPKFFAKFSNLTILKLSSAHLEGQFPEDIFKVPTLQFLDLSANVLLNGHLPAFPKGSSFRTITLDFTKFSGPLPLSIGNLENLVRIGLSNCSFSGPIPPNMTNLSHLVHLDFSSNNFTGQVPSFQKSRNLTYADLSHNALTGAILSTGFDGLPYLSTINLANNELSGKIPSSIFTLPSLRQLQLSNNHFSGQIDELPNGSSTLLMKLNTLDLSNNNLTGSIPKSFFQLKHLNVLSLSSNFFGGTVQLDAIMNLRNLTTLDLSYNNLTVDPRINNVTSTTLSQLGILKLASCNLRVFPKLKNQLNLAHLDLSDNKIAGEVPNWIWGVGGEVRIHVNLSKNVLKGLENPPNFRNLVVLDLHENHLGGEVPIPPTSAIYVDYSSNNFSNSIPSNIGNNMSYTTFFSLANNSLTGRIPESICNGNNLRVLDLSLNALNGSIPSCLVTTNSNLGVLNLARNKFSGSIPDSFPDSCDLKTLDLSENGLEGKVPGSLVNCTLLEVLNIGKNGIEDAFPCMLKNSSRLRVLVLRANKFQGKVQCEGADDSWSQLQIIDISSNNFSGALLPTCFANWTNMMVGEENVRPPGDHLHFNFLDLNNLYYQDKVTVNIKGLELELVKILRVFTSVDFSSNNFTGAIPESIGNLTSLYVLNFSHNSFGGSIPSSIGQLRNLGSLDLSKNNLTGEIPGTLADLKFLAALNLSYNYLSGKIPQGTQFQTFSNNSYEGNRELCGFPLSIGCSDPGSCRDPFDASCSKTSSVVQDSTNELDLRFIFTGLGLGVGAAIMLALVAFSRKFRNRYDKKLHKMFLFFFPSYSFTYVRYDEMKIVEGETFEDSSSDASEEFVEEVFHSEVRGTYCVYCTKLDVHRKKAIHNLKCNCHESPSKISYSHTSSSSFSLLVMYH